MRTLVSTITVLAVCWQSSPACRADLLVAGFSADAVIRYDGTTGALVGAFATDASMNGPTALVYNSAGHLLVLNEFSGNVLEFNGMTGAFIGELISPAALGSVGVTDPGDMEIGPDGNLYITSHFSTGGNVWKFHGTTGAYLGVFASTGSVEHTHGLTFGPDGHLYQHNLSAGSIIRFDGTTGAPLGTFATAPGLFPGADLVFGPTGTLYASIDGGGGTKMFSPAGTPLGDLIPPGTSTWGLLVDGGTLYVGATSTGIIKKFDAATGTFLGDFITGVPAPFDMIVLSSAVPEVGAAAMLSLAAACAAGMLAIKKWRNSHSGAK